MSLTHLNPPTMHRNPAFSQGVVIEPGSRLIVVRGDNLWSIARAHYGTGFHHTVIYGANKEQIRNPDLIYPGQVFSLPKVN